MKKDKISVSDAYDAYPTGFQQLSQEIHHVEGQIQRVKFCSEVDLVAEERGEEDHFNLGLFHSGFLGNSVTRETKTWARRYQPPSPQCITRALDCL